MFDGKRVMHLVCWFLIAVAFVLAIIFAGYTLTDVFYDKNADNSDTAVFISATDATEITAITESTVSTEATAAAERQRNEIDEKTAREYAVKYGSLYNVDSNLILAVIKVESGFNANAVSRSDARGLMQIKPSTYLGEIYYRIGTDDDTELLYDAEFNVMCGAFYIHLLNERYGICGIEQLAAAYNYGVTNVLSLLENPEYSPDGKTLYADKIPNTSAKNYVRWVRSAYNEYVSKYGVDTLNDFEYKNLNI